MPQTFNVGDKVAHVFHGAGEVLDPQRSGIEVDDDHLLVRISKTNELVKVRKVDSEKLLKSR